MGQLGAMIFAGGLSPAMGVLPLRNLSVDGRAGYLAPVLAMAAAAVLALLLAGPALGPDGLAGVFSRAFGQTAARVLAAGYGAWLFLVLCAGLRRFGERFLSATYRDGRLETFLFVLGALLLWMLHGRLSAFARAGRIFFYMLAAMLVVILALSVPGFRLENVLPDRVDDLWPAARSVKSALAAFSPGVLALFLGGVVLPAPGDRRRLAGWVCALGLTVGAAFFLITGVFGVGLTARLEMPFFLLAKEINFYNAMERMESLVVALWFLADVVYLGLVAWELCALFRFAFRFSGAGTAVATPVLLAALPGAFLVAADGFALGRFYIDVIDNGMLAAAYLLPALALAVLWLRTLWQGRRNSGKAQVNTTRCSGRFGPEQDNRGNLPKGEKSS